MTRVRWSGSLALAGAIVAFTAASSSGGAQQSPRAPAAIVAESILDARTREVSSQLRCPVCQGLSLQDSPSELSQQMRDVVRQQLAAGRNPAEVRAYFVGRYGEWILMRPEPHGFNWVVYALPLVLLAGGAWLLVFAVRKWTTDAPPLAGSRSPSGGARTAP
jgi:cytochrome c-type biogenesis protein CcmH/NrfF